MNIERELGVFVHKIDNRRAERNIVHEMAVHNVAMDPVGAGLFDALEFRGEARKIGGEDGGRDQNRHGVMEEWRRAVMANSNTPPLHYSSGIALDGALARFMLRRFQPVRIALSAHGLL